MLDIDGYQLPYEVTGSGPALVLLHDGFLHSPAWDYQVAPFAQHYQTVRYDRRGYGASALPTEPYSLVDDLAHLLDALQLETVALIGSSMGGGLALEFALHHPDRVRHLVLVGAAVLGFAMTDHFHQRLQTRTLPLHECQNVEQTIANWLADPYLFAAESDQARDHFRQILAQNPQNLTNTFHLMKMPADLSLGRLTKLTIPTLIVVGEVDIPDVHATAGALQALLPNTRRVIIPNAGHFAYMEQPDHFNQLVLDFLGG
jgi:pimeloyl-ACP methyl ester carboxylesterase